MNLDFREEPKIVKQSSEPKNKKEVKQEIEVEIKPNQGLTLF